MFITENNVEFMYYISKLNKKPIISELEKSKR